MLPQFAFLILPTHTHSPGADVFGLLTATLLEQSANLALHGQNVNALTRTRRARSLLALLERLLRLLLLLSLFSAQFVRLRLLDSDWNAGALFGLAGHFLLRHALHTARIASRAHADAATESSAT